MRHATVLQVAKLRFGDGREELCLLRDVSPEGVRAEVYCPIAPGAHVEIELPTGHAVGGACAWNADGHAGIVFDQPMQMSVVLAHCSFDNRLGRLRPPRIAVDLGGSLRIGVEDHAVRIGNISQAGVQASAATALHAGSPCAITLPRLAARTATIRWWRGHDGGLMLAEPLDYAVFAAWRAALAGGD